jgi:hypothetical protein
MKMYESILCHFDAQGYQFPGQSNIGQEDEKRLNPFLKTAACEVEVPGSTPPNRTSAVRSFGPKRGTSSRDNWELIPLSILWRMVQKRKHCRLHLYSLLECCKHVCAHCSSQGGYHDNSSHRSSDLVLAGWRRLGLHSLAPVVLPGRIDGNPPEGSDRVHSWNRSFIDGVNSDPRGTFRHNEEGPGRDPGPFIVRRKPETELRLLLERMLKRQIE